MKKLLFVPLVLAGALSAFADSFTDVIQDLAVQTACIGTYSATQAGGGWYDDPHDYYTPQMMAERFAKMSGNMTRTATFYGICFDYAQAAWEDIVNYKSWYNELGMCEGQFWLAGVQNDPNEIQLQYPGTRGNYTAIQNGVYVIYPNGGLRNVKTHRMNDGKGSRATNHAWLWVERADGVWFWVDPTWTDNVGYVVYGYVKNGEEVQCRPDRKFCINYPEHLNSLPLPPSMGARMAPSKSANSTNRNETIKNARTDLDKKNLETDLLISVNVPFSSFRDKYLSVDKMSFSLEVADVYRGIDNKIISLMGGVEYLRNIDDDYCIHSGLIMCDYVQKLAKNISCYFGGGIGLRFDALNKENHYAPVEIPNTEWFNYKVNAGWFAFKANTGFLFSISGLCMKIDAAYDNVMGFSAGIGVGLECE